MGWHARTNVLICQRIWSVTERSTFLGKQKTNMERRRLLGKRTLAFEKTKPKQMERCNPPRFKTNRRMKGSGTLQYRILSALQLLPSARTKASVRFSTERKTNGALLQRCKSRRVVRGTRRGSILLLLGQRQLFLCQAWKQGSTGRLESMGRLHL